MAEVDHAENFLEEASLVDKIDYFNRLPIEVQDMIFNEYLTRRDRKSARLVCRSWYDRNTHEETLEIGPSDASTCTTIEPQYLENCGFEILNLHFQSVNVNQIPVTVWEKIGTRVRSLKFNRCRLGNQAIKNVILCCENLQVLVVWMAAFPDEADSFCSLRALKKFTVIRKTLHTLRIYHFSLESSIDFEKWKRIFRAFHRVFPNVVHYGAGTIFLSEESRFRIKFSKESLEKDDQSRLIDALAHCMSTHIVNSWKNALLSLSTQRLTKVSIFLNRFDNGDENSLLDFFGHHEELKFIEVGVKGGSIDISDEFFVIFFFYILEHCLQLREFYFCEKVYWLPSLKEEQYSQLVAKTSTLKKFTINDLLIEGSAMRACDPKRAILRHGLQPHPERFNDTGIRSLIPYFDHLQSLVLAFRISDGNLRAICKHMTDLKTLEVEVYCTKKNLASDTKCERTSIKRLRHLERLKIDVSHGCEMVNDALYKEFELPKLRYLFCILPEDTSVLDLIGTKLPLLEEIDFSQTKCIPYGDTNLHFRTCRKNILRQDIFQVVDLAKLFVRCPTLQSIRYYRGTYFYEPFTKKVAFTKKKFIR